MCLRSSGLNHICWDTALRLAGDQGGCDRLILGGWRGRCWGHAKRGHTWDTHPHHGYKVGRVHGRRGWRRGVHHAGGAGRWGWRRRRGAGGERGLNAWRRRHHGRGAHGWRGLRRRGRGLLGLLPGWQVPRARTGGGLAPKWVGELVSPPAPDSGVGAKWIERETERKR